MVVDLQESRSKIDKIDAQIVKLFEERMEVANDVAAYKRSTGKKVYDAAREDEKIQTLRKMADSPFNETAIEDLFRQIMSISRKYQYQKLGESDSTQADFPLKEVDKLDIGPDTRVCFFGERGAFSEQAMLEYFGEDVKSFNRTTFKDVMEAVASGEAEYGVLPIENTSTGSIQDIYDLLVHCDNTLVAEHVVRVQQSLLVKPGTRLEDIRTVYSHPQALKQCKSFFEEHDWMKGEEFASTAGAAKKVAESGDGSMAAIGSVRAAQIFGLEVLCEGINFNKQNFTRFVIISSKKEYLKDANKVCISFEIKHEVGSLYNMLANFYYNGLNMTKIESRPMDGGPKEGQKWEYRFIVDLEGNLKDPGVRNAFATVAECVSSLKILGNFQTK